MGVQNLWKILQNTARPVGLSELAGKTLVIDLSIWICENSNLAYSASNQKPHLRTLFFRCKALLELGCVLLFVREGDVIELKKETMRRRNQARHGVPQSVSKSNSNVQKRSRFDAIADECHFNVKCCELLKSMGVKVIRSPCGEAEKACAFLNMIGRCDAVITDDSDALLYGAKVVYRNFGTDKSQETIEEYCSKRIEKELGYTRQTLVGLALLLGCDYDPRGVPGVGKELACKFADEALAVSADFLTRLRTLGKNECSSKYEARVRKLLLADTQNFPNEEIISEFLNFTRTEQIILSDEKYLQIEWSRPNLRDAQLFHQRVQNWEFSYTALKLIPLIVLFESGESKRVRDVGPMRIEKERCRQSTKYYEVRWAKMRSQVDQDLSELGEYVTLERVEFMKANFPILVADFDEKIAAKKNSRKVRKRISEGIEELEDGLHESLMELYADQRDPDDAMKLAAQIMASVRKTKKKNGASKQREKPETSSAVKSVRKALKNELPQSDRKHKKPVVRLASVFEKTKVEAEKKEKCAPLVDVIVLDTDSENDASIVEIANEPSSSSADDILLRLDKLSINEPKTTQPPTDNETFEKSFLPLSMRLKKMCQKTSILS